MDSKKGEKLFFVILIKEIFFRVRRTREVDLRRTRPSKNPTFEEPDLRGTRPSRNPTFESPTFESPTIEEETIPLNIKNIII